MKVKVSIEYFTSFGESICMVLGNGNSVPMQYVLEGIWMGETTVPSSARSLDYTFEVRRNGKAIRREWSGHSIPLPSGKKPAELEVRDAWHDRPSDSPFWTKAFTDVIFRKGKPARQSRNGNLALMVAAPQVRRGEILAIAGSGPALGDWEVFHPLSASSSPLWSIFIDAQGPFEYKFVIIDAARNPEPGRWVQTISATEVSGMIPC